VVGVLVTTAAWIVARGLAAQHHLNTAETSLQTARQAVESRDLVRARKAVRQAGADTSRARDLTSDPLWRAISAVPFVGRTPRAVRVVAAATDDVVRKALPSLVRAAGKLEPGRLRTAGTQIDLDALTTAQPLLDEADRQVASAGRRLDTLQGPFLGPVGSGLVRVREKTTTLQSLTSTARRAAHLLPPMLGADGTRQYFVGVLNPAEARGTGGFLGAYGVVEARQGRLDLVRLGSNTELKDASTVPVDLGADYAALYGNDPALWINANLSPSFPYAARIWTALYERQFGVRLDGVLTVDPLLMGYLLEVTGPAELNDGTRVSGKDAPGFVMSDIYRRFPSQEDDARRDAYLINLGQAVIGQLFSGEGDSRQLLDALARGAREGRLRLWSARPGEQRQLENTPLAGSVPTSRGPYVQVAVNNGGGNKLDYYLDRAVRYSLGPCQGARRSSRVTIRLTNRTPTSPLPSYVLGNTAIPATGTPPPPRTNRVLLYVFTTRGTRMSAARVDGRPLALRRFAERGHPVYAFPLDLAPGVPREIVLDLDEPATDSAPRVVEQPLARPQRSVITGNRCG
jgi:hypothetical protein